MDVMKNRVRATAPSLEFSLIRHVAALVNPFTSDCYFAAIISANWRVCRIIGGRRRSRKSFRNWWNSLYSLLACPLPLARFLFSSRLYEFQERKSRTIIINITWFQLEALSRVSSFAVFQKSVESCYFLHLNPSIQRCIVIENFVFKSYLFGKSQ